MVVIGSNINMFEFIGYLNQDIMYTYYSILQSLTLPRDAEAGSILGVNTPHFFGLTTPTFWRELEMGAGEKFRR